MSEQFPPDEVLEQYEQVRRTGQCNMLDPRCVERVAESHNFRELIIAIEDGRYDEIVENYDRERATELIQNGD